MHPGATTWSLPFPLRSLYARDVPNLFLAGRDISASHVACCSTRVMLTCTSCGEAVGAAAALSVQTRRLPDAVATDNDSLAELRQRLERAGHYVPYAPLAADRLPNGTVASASSEAPLEQTDVTEFRRSPTLGCFHCRFESNDWRQSHYA